MNRLLRRLFTPPLMLMAALFLFFEEWLWERLKAMMAAFGRLPLMRGLEARIVALPPGPALAVFLAPSTLLLPVKLVALWFIGHGHALEGIAVILAAKVLGMAVFSRIFVLCKPALLTVPRFQRFHDWVLAWSTRLHAWADSIPAWQAARRRLHAWRSAFRKGGPLSRRWRAIRARAGRSS